MSNRLAGLVVVLGGALLALNYVFWTGYGLAPDWINVSPGSLAGTLTLLAVGAGALLLTLGVPTVMARQRRRLGSAGMIGGWLLVAGFLLWALSTLATLSLLVLPWWASDLDQIALAIGSVLFGLATLDAGVLPGAAALLLVVGGLVGLLPTSVPDLLFLGAGIDVSTAPAAVRTLGYVALVVFGLAWAWLGYAVSQRA